MSQPTRILDRSTYDRKTIVTYEMAAAYYTDIFYNHLYFEAKRIKNDGNVASVTEGYKHALNAFLQGMGDPKLYKKSLLGMHTYFIDNGFRNLTFSQCIDRLIVEFIPDDYIESITSTKKNAILHLVLSNVTTNFIYKIIGSYLGMIIDNHQEADNARVLQEEFIDLLLIERNNMFKKFVGGSSKRKTIDISVIEDMQREIKSHLSEKYQLKKNITDLKKVLIFKEDKYKRAMEKIQELTDLVSELQNELEEAKVLTSINAQSSTSAQNAENAYEAKAEVFKSNNVIASADDTEEIYSSLMENNVSAGDADTNAKPTNIVRFDNADAKTDYDYNDDNDDDDEPIIEPMNKPDNIFEEKNTAPAPSNESSKAADNLIEEIIWND